MRGGFNSKHGTGREPMVKTVNLLVYRSSQEA
jgi:hypothetical protein